VIDRTTNINEVIACSRTWTDGQTPHDSKNQPCCRLVSEGNSWYCQNSFSHSLIMIILSIPPVNLKQIKAVKNNCPATCSMYFQGRSQDFYFFLGGGLKPQAPPPPSSPPFRSRPPLLRLGGLGERFRYLVNFRLKILPLVATIFRSFSGNKTSKYDRHVGCLLVASTLSNVPV